MLQARSVFAKEHKRHGKLAEGAATNLQFLKTRAQIAHLRDRGVVDKHVLRLGLRAGADVIHQRGLAVEKVPAPGMNLPEHLEAALRLPFARDHHIAGDLLQSS